MNFTEGTQLVRQMFVLGTYEEFPVDKILELLATADELYYNDEESFIDDAQYDALRQYAQRLSPADKYFTGVGSQVRGGKIDLPYKMGSLNQVYQGDYVKWIAQHDLADAEVIISDKLDGASVMVVYDTDGKLQIAYSRGDGEQGADITRHVSKIHNVPHKIKNKTGAPITIRAENIISPRKFTEINTGDFSRGRRIYKNPRNMVSGLMNSSENHPEIYNTIDLVAYEVVGGNMSKEQHFETLMEYGFDVAVYEVYRAGDLDDESLTGILTSRRSLTKYEIDGIVIDINSPKIRARLATQELNPEYAVKFKVADASNLVVATVRNVEWNLSKDGYYKPRVQIHPVELVGVTVSNLTGFNAKFIQESGIGPGAKIKVTRSGDVIPFILETVERVEPQMPDDDTAVWTATGVDLVVSDASNNDTVRFESLCDFFNSIDVPGLGAGNLKEMFDMGFDVPEKIIPLTQEDISNLVNSKSIGGKIFKAMKARFTNIPLYELMGSHAAFGRGVGVRKMKKLYEAFEGDMSKCESITQITMVDSFEHKTAVKIQSGYSTFLEFYRKVSKYITVAPFQAKKEGTLSGKTFVFTGFRNAELEKKIVDVGGKMGTTVSSKTTYLVTAEANSTSGKATKARELGVTVIGVEELKGML